MSTSTTKFPLYVYTAVDGYAWQGCEGSLVSELEGIRATAVGRNRLPDPNGSPSPSTVIGGVLHCELRGKTGMAVWRVHVRRHGDFEGRDSRYIALLFLPRHTIDPQRIDFASLWEAPLLREPKSGDVSNLSIDLADPKWSCLNPQSAPSPKDLSPDSFAHPIDTRQKAPSMDALNDILHNGLSLFGTLAVRVFPGDDETLPAIQWSYEPYPEITTAEELRAGLTEPPSDYSASKSLEKKAVAAAESLEQCAKSHPDAPALAAYAKTFSATVADFRKAVARRVAPSQRMDETFQDPIANEGAYQSRTPRPITDPVHHDIPLLVSTSPTKAATTMPEDVGKTLRPRSIHWKLLVLLCLIFFLLGILFGTRLSRNPSSPEDSDSAWKKPFKSWFPSRH